MPLVWSNINKAYPFEIDLSDEIGMEVDNEREVDEEGGDDVQNI